MPDTVLIRKSYCTHTEVMRMSYGKRDFATEKTAKNALLTKNGNSGKMCHIRSIAEADVCNLTAWLLALRHNQNTKIMARQKDLLRLEGKVGAFSFVHGRDGFSARKSEGMNGDRILNDARFARTRENGAEFGRAGKAGKVLRDALINLTSNVSDRRVTSRLTTTMLKVVKSDASSDRGLRTATLGDVKLLEGFEFNIGSPLRTVFKAEYQKVLNKETGAAIIVLPSYNPTRTIAVPEGATHYSLLLGIVAADFEEGSSNNAVSISEPREAINENVAAEELTIALPQPSPDLPTFLVFGIEFMQVVNGKSYPLINSGFNALQIVASE
jgi:hypothetical protein